MSESDAECTNFTDLGLNQRLVRAASFLGWNEPTPVQEAAIPLINEGKDVFMKAKTGTGKTAAYCLPLLSQLLDRKSKSSREKLSSVVVLAPSKELCKQAATCVNDLSKYCSDLITVTNVFADVPLNHQKPMLNQKPDIIVGTPSRILAHAKCKNFDIASVSIIVVDEADLLFSFGFALEMEQLESLFPTTSQRILVSATLPEELISLKKALLHNPVVIKLNESQLPDPAQLQQYVIRTSEQEKFLLICSLIKLKLLRGRSLVFVSSVNRAYRLKLFLSHFGVAACVLNSELPLECRCHILEQFNEKKYSIVIATDDEQIVNPAAAAASSSGSSTATGAKNRGKRKTRESAKKDYKVSRGIDFQAVNNVVNFDFPPSLTCYIHRVGRTARAGQKVRFSALAEFINMGTALSFLLDKEQPLFDEINSEVSSDGDKKSSIREYKFNMDEVDGFRYRVADAMRSVTRLAVKETRLKEIADEVSKSEKLKSYFQDNPDDLGALRHDQEHVKSKLRAQLSHVPDYIVPKSLRGMNATLLEKEKKRKSQRNRDFYRQQAKKTKFRRDRSANKQESDPLRSFKLSKRSADTASKGDGLKRRKTDAGL